MNTQTRLVGQIIGWEQMPPDPKIIADNDEELVPDGRILSREEYPMLYAVIGTTYSRSGNEFRVPDLRARIVVSPPMPEPPPEPTEVEVSLEDRLEWIRTSFPGCNLAITTQMDGHWNIVVEYSDGAWKSASAEHLSYAVERLCEYLERASRWDTTNS